MRRSFRFLLLSVALVLVSFVGMDKAVADVTGTCAVHCENGTTFSVQSTKADCCTFYLGLCGGGAFSYATWTVPGTPVFYCAPPLDE
ncbi:MAG: hypothetical protein ACJ76Y_16080 [Thermoanaerobaculia bacterium]